MSKSIKVLFVCTGNAGRSQMAQAMFRHLAGDSVVVESAGVQPWQQLHPMAVRVMAKRGLNLNGHVPKSVSVVERSNLPDMVVTLGNDAKEKIPSRLVGSAVWIHWNIPDPADADGTPESEAVFDRTAEEIAKRLSPLLELLPTLSPRRAVSQKPGIGTGLWGPGQFQPGLHLPAVAQAGFSAIELNIFWGRKHFDWNNSAAVRELRRVADDLGIAIWSIHSPDVGSLAASDRQIRIRQLNALRSCLELAENLGAKVIASHGLVLRPGRDDLARDDLAACESRLAESIEELAREVESSPCKIAFENGYARIPGYWARDVIRRVHLSSKAAFGFVLDTGHANLAGDLNEISALVGDSLLSLHLNDNDGRKDLHLPPGEGSVDWTAVAHSLRETQYSGCVLYEVMPNGREPGDVLGNVMNWHKKLLDVLQT